MIDAATVKKMAELSRLHLTEDEVTRFAHDLGAILDYAVDLPELETHYDREAILRLAKDIPSEWTDDVLQNSAELMDGAVKVKAILDRSES